jgi:PAS domain-containing protein
VTWHLVGQDLEDCYHRGKTVVRENMLIPLLHNGKLRDGWFTYYLIPIFENGKSAGIYDPYMNTTEAVLTKRELAAVAGRLGQFLSVTRDSIVAVDRDWRFSYFNEAALKTYAAASRELLGKKLWEEFPEAVYEGSPYVEHYERAMYEGVSGSLEATIPNP